MQLYFILFVDRIGKADSLILVNNQFQKITFEKYPTTESTITNTTYFMIAYLKNITYYLFPWLKYIDIISKWAAIDSRIKARAVANQAL